MSCQTCGGTGVLMGHNDSGACPACQVPLRLGSVSLPPPTVQVSQVDLRPHLEWALRQLRMFVTEDYGYGVFTKPYGPVTELPGFGEKYRAAEQALNEAKR